MEQYRFGIYLLDADRTELRCGDDPVKLEPQVFDLLIHLVRNRHRTVSKDDLIAQVWGGRIVSESTLCSRIWTVRHAIGDDGRQQRLVRTLPRKGFRFLGAVQCVGCEIGDDSTPARPAPACEPPAHREPQTAPPLIHRRPSVAVLPFTNPSRDPGLECLTDGVVEELTTALSRRSWFVVIGRNSSRAYEGRCVDARQAGRELDAKYLIEGSVRKAASRVRVTARLVDSSTGVCLWANNFACHSGSTFDGLDEVSAGIAAAVVPKLEDAEIRSVTRERTTGRDAYEFHMCGMSRIYRWTEAGVEEALGRFNKAIEADPDFVPAYGMAAYCYVQRKSYGWFTDPSQEIAACERFAQRAAELGSEDSVALARAAHAFAYVVGDVGRGKALCELALQLNPDEPLGLYVSGTIKMFLGQPDAAIEHLTRALDRNPFDPIAFKMHAAVAYAHLFARRFDLASEAAEYALRAHPDYLTGMRAAAASHAVAGRLTRAKRLVSQMRVLDSALRISNLKNLFPLRRTEDLDRWAEGLQKAGLPN